MIYTKSMEGRGNTSLHVSFKNMTALTPEAVEPGTIYWHDQHDVSVRSLFFTSFLDEVHWAHLRNDPTSKILLFYGDEYFNSLDIDMFANGIKERNIRPEQVYLITIDKNWEDWARELFAERGVTSINITHYNLLLKRTKIPDQMDEFPFKRFSSFSRNFNIWRLNLFLNLKNNELLDDFYYSFNNLNPYTKPPTVISHHEVIKASKDLRVCNTRIIDWIRGMPYTMPETPITLKWSSVSYDLIRCSGIHLLIESHFDPFLNASGHREQLPIEYFSPIFPTEKTYKTIFCKTPFIAFTTPFFMKELKKLGFKTFDPYIDESYDSIEDNQLRMEAIVSEISRLSKLDNEEFKTLLINLEDTVQYNFNVLVEMKKQVKYPPNFFWLNRYMVEYDERRDGFHE